MGIIEKIFGTHSQNELKRIYPIVDRIEAMEPEMKALSDEELRGKTREFKGRHWMTFSRKRTLSCARLHSGAWACAITEYRLSAVLSFTRDVSQR